MQVRWLGGSPDGAASLALPRRDSWGAVEAQLRPKQAGARSTVRGETPVADTERRELRPRKGRRLRHA